MFQMLSSLTNITVTGRIQVRKDQEQQNRER